EQPFTNLPYGTVTFLFTDIEGSTELLKKLGDQYADLLAQQRDLLREIFDRWDGGEVDMQGDSFFYSFPRATQAVSAAVEAQRECCKHDWPEGVELRVRMGLHTGEPLTWTEGYVGMDVHRAARIAAVGHGGQVLLSGTTTPLVIDDLPDGVSVIDLGLHRMKDMRRPERIHQLMIEGLSSDFPPLKSLDARLNNLPTPPTILIGREAELQSAQDLLCRPDVRVLTLSGPGGIGKTRLGLQLASDLLDQFDDGIFFVPLAPVADPMLVPSTIAQTLGVRNTGSQPVLEAVGNYLGSQQVLLFLDNFEHVQDASHELVRVLDICPNLKMLITSREILNIRGEHEFPVGPLPSPELPSSVSLDQVRLIPAVELFSQRAQAVKPNFIIDNQNAHAVAEICTRLDGLPLAIELAAARVKMFAPDALLGRLVDAEGGSTLAVLSRGPRDAPERHRTLVAAMEWSYELLNHDEKNLLQALSVFSGGFTLSAAEKVCCSRGGTSSENTILTQREAILENLASLMDKSLIMQDEGYEGQARFSMLGLIRDFSREKLKENEWEVEIRKRHADYFLAVVEDAKPKLMGSEQEEWLERLEIEHNNIRSSLRWLIDRAEDESGDAEDAASSALRMSGDLWRFWDTHGHNREGREWFREIFSLTDASSIEGVDALIGAAMLARRLSLIDEATQYYNQGLASARELNYKAGIAEILGGLGYLEEYKGAKGETADELYRESLELWRETGDKRGVATALGPLAQRAASDYDFEKATSLFEESLSLFREVGDKREIAGALWNLGQISVSLGRYEKAAEMYRESYALYEELNDLHGVATQLRSLGEIARMVGDLRRAHEQFIEALDTFRSIGDTRCSSIALSGLGETALDQEEATAAIAFALEALSISREIGFQRTEARVLRLLGRCDLAQGDLESARGRYHMSLKIERGLDDLQGIAECLEGFAFIAFIRTEYVVAVQIIHASEALRDRLRTPLPSRETLEFESWKIEARAELGEKEYETARSTGTELTVKQANSMALAGE
ncbi:MAG: tetratricopeptide repeat protein, partial [Anaerolineales bacterium]